MYLATGSAVVSSSAADRVTITVTCANPFQRVTFAGDKAIFVAGSGFADGPQGDHAFALRAGLAPGIYPERFLCTASGQTQETLTANVVIGQPRQADAKARMRIVRGVVASVGASLLAFAGLVCGGRLLLARRRRRSA